LLLLYIEFESETRRESLKCISSSGTSDFFILASFDSSEGFWLISIIELYKFLLLSPYATTLD